MISMVLQSRSSTPADVGASSTSNRSARACAPPRRPPHRGGAYLQVEIDRRESSSATPRGTSCNARRFHEALVSRCGNEPMILLIGSFGADLVGARVLGVGRQGRPDGAQDHAGRTARDISGWSTRSGTATPIRAVRLAQDHLAAADATPWRSAGTEPLSQADFEGMPRPPTIGAVRGRRRPPASPPSRSTTPPGATPMTPRCADARPSSRHRRRDDDITVVLLRGAEGVFSTGADMNNAHGWYGKADKAPGPSRVSVAG